MREILPRGKEEAGEHRRENGVHASGSNKGTGTVCGRGAHGDTASGLHKVSVLPLPGMLPYSPVEHLWFGKIQPLY